MANLEDDWQMVRKLLESEIAHLKKVLSPQALEARDDVKIYNSKDYFAECFPSAKARSDYIEQLRAVDQDVDEARRTLREQAGEISDEFRRPRRNPWEKDPDAWKRGG